MKKNLRRDILIVAFMMDRIYSDRRATVGGETSNKSTGHWTPWYGGKGYKMFRGADKPTTWDGVGWYPQGRYTTLARHRYDGQLMVLFPYICW